jgi:hypothetical protein
MLCFTVYFKVNPDLTGSFQTNKAERFISSKATPHVNTGVGRCDANPEMRGVS